MITRKCLCFAAGLLIVALSLTLPVYAENEVGQDTLPDANLSDTHIIEIDLAKFVAADYLPKFYKGDWVFFDYFVCYDLDGLPAAYAMIFRKANSLITTCEELDAVLHEIRKKRSRLINQISQTQESTELSEEAQENKLNKLRKLTNRQKRALFQADVFATVITGATEISPMLIRCYIGLPPFIAKKVDIETKLAFQYPDKRLQLGRILYFSPADIRYEVKEGAEPRVPVSAAKGGERILKRAISGDSYTISKDKKDLLKISVERQKLRERLDEKNKALKKMNSKNRKMIEESDNKRKQHYMTKWAKYKKKHLEDLENVLGGEVKK